MNRQSISMPKNTKITALYSRLSRDDELSGESGSITKEILLTLPGLVPWRICFYIYFTLTFKVSVKQPMKAMPPEH